MISTEGLADLLADPARAADVAPEAIPALLLAALAEQARLAAVGAALAARLAMDAPHGPLAAARARERLLTAKEVAARLGYKLDWVYEHQEDLPFTRRVGRGLRFSEAGLERWLASRPRLTS